MSQVSNDALPLDHPVTERRTLHRLRRDPFSAGVLRGEVSVLDGEIVESPEHIHVPGYRHCDRCGCQAPLCDRCHATWRGGHQRPTQRIRKAAKA